MPNLFASLPIRANGGGGSQNPVTASWWNDIRTALITAFGLGSIGETTFTFTNNQAAAANVTGLSFDKTLYRTGIAKVCVRRKTDTASSEVRAVHALTIIYNTQADTWILIDEWVGEDDGIVFSITSAGQVQYTSTNIAGANGVHTSRFRAETFNV